MDDTPIFWQTILSTGIDPFHDIERWTFDVIDRTTRDLSYMILGFDIFA